MGLWKTLFGAGYEKHEEKGDELRLDLMYRESAFSYRKALEVLGDKSPSDMGRIENKLKEVRSKAAHQLIEEAEEILADDDLDLAADKLNLALNFTDDPELTNAITSQLRTIAVRKEEGNPRLETEVDIPEEVAGTDEDLYELALAGLEPEDQDRAIKFGEPFREAYEHCQHEQWEEAKEKFKGLLQHHGDDPLILELAAMVHDQLGDTDEAADLYEKVWDMAPSRGATVQGLVEVYRKTEQDDKVFELLSNACRRRPMSDGYSIPWLAIHMDRAHVLAERGQIDLAIESFKELLRIPEVDRGHLLFNLAGVCELGGRDEDCLAALEAAIESSPRSALYRERLADFHVKRDTELEAALKLLYEANEVETTGGASMFGGGAGKVRISPNRGRYLYKMARVYFLMGNDAEARETLDTARAVTEDPAVLQAIEGLHEELEAPPAAE